jgi:hypothetical protein
LPDIETIIFTLIEVARLKDILGQRCCIAEPLCWNWKTTHPQARTA